MARNTTSPLLLLTALVAAALKLSTARSLIDGQVGAKEFSASPRLANAQALIKATSAPA